MERNINQSVDGWTISLNRNVHMYTHSLSVNKGKNSINIDCEDLPTKVKTIGIWLHNLDVSDTLKKEIQNALLKWVNQFDVTFQIYITKDEFITNN
ncbi:MAG: hypothetical protein ABW162_17410 [Candidatus Sedimenticola sp. PURPLELP]